MPRNKKALRHSCRRASCSRQWRNLKHELDASRVYRKLTHTFKTLLERPASQQTRAKHLTMKRPLERKSLGRHRSGVHSLGDERPNRRRGRMLQKERLRSTAHCYAFSTVVTAPDHLRNQIGKIVPHRNIVLIGLDPFIENRCPNLRRQRTHPQPQQLMLPAIQRVSPTPWNMDRDKRVTGDLPEVSLRQTIGLD